MPENTLWRFSKCVRPCSERALTVDFFPLGQVFGNLWKQLVIKYNFCFSIIHLQIAQKRLQPFHIFTNEIFVRIRFNVKYICNLYILFFFFFTLDITFLNTHLQAPGLLINLTYYSSILQGRVHDDRLLHVDGLEGFNNSVCHSLHSKL